MTQYVTVELPRPTFERLQRTAQQQNRSISDMLDALISRVEQLPPLPDDVARELAALSSLSDDVLLALVRQPMSDERQEELTLLNEKAQNDVGLTATEMERQKKLGEIYQRSVLRRAHCLGRLHQRGLDLEQVLQKEE